ncbi:hypothetical protein ACX3VG_07470, partial [Escherichia coli]
SSLVGSEMCIRDRYFALQNDGSFTSDIIMVEAHKAA